MEMLIVLIVSIIKSYTVRGIETLDLKPELKALLKSKQEKHGCEKGNNTRTYFPNSKFHYPGNPETVKGELWGLRQFLAFENPLKMMKNAFYFILKARLVLKYLNFCLYFLIM